MTNIWNDLRQGWGFIRLIRLGFGLFLGYNALQFRDPLAGMLAGLFLFQAITNTGCCGTAGCATERSTETKAGHVEEITFEEVKPTELKGRENRL